MNNSKKLQPKGFIPLSGADIDTSRVKKLKIRITSKFFSRVYELKADNVTEYEKWVREMRKVAQKVPEKERESAVEARKEILSEHSRTVVLFDRSSVYGGKNAQLTKGKSIVQKKRKKEVSLEDFEILCVVGRGSFGKVMKVRDLDTGEIFAMKAIKKSAIVESNMVESTKNEQLIMRTIRHPFIVGLHYAFQSPERLYLVQDFLSGGELFWHLQQDTRFSVVKARFYSAEIFLGIEHLHNNNIIYRDLKPENIVLDSEGHAVLTDFGLSKTEVSNSSQTYTFCGTPEYLAPEILKGQGHGKEVDWWSFGIMLYTFLVGNAPFYSDNTMVMYQMIMSLGKLTFPDHVPQDAQNIIAKLLERTPEKRLTAEEIRKHPFYSAIDWTKLERKLVTPPFIPKNDDDDTKYFDTMFTDEDPRAESFVERNDNIQTFDEDFKSFAFNGRAKANSIMPKKK